MTDSFNFGEDIRSILTNENLNINTNNNQIEQYQKQLFEYEHNNNSKKEPQYHFDFKSELPNNNLAKNNDDNKTNNNNSNIINNGNNINNENNPNNDNNLNNIFNNNENDDDFLSNVVINKNCRLFSNSKYIVFENNYGENSCYINVLLHFLYNSKDICNYLKNLYLSNKSLKDNDKNNNEGKQENNNDDNIKNDNISLNKEEEKNQKIIFLTMLGKILYQYNKGLENASHQIIQLKTIDFREKLNMISKGQFPLNYVADPVDFLNYLFDILNEFNKEDMKKNFYLKLNEQFICNIKCNIYRSNRYDNDNFIYQIYIEEVINYLIKFKIKEKNYSNKFFQFCQLTNLQDSIKCSKCKNDMKKKICCRSYPNYLIINCAWNQPKPEIEKVIKLFVLLSLKDDLKNLFQMRKTKNINLNYNLTHIILYSSNLAHYITILYNPKEKLFCLYDDSCIIEFYTLIEVIEAITINLISNNENNYFYPVLLIYSKFEVYDENTLNNNKLNEESYKNLINNCNLAIQQYRFNNNLTEKEKNDIYQKMVEKQILFDNNNNLDNNTNSNSNINDNQKDNNKIIDFYNSNVYNNNDQNINNMNSEINKININKNINNNINHINNNENNDIIFNSKILTINNNNMKNNNDNMKNNTDNINNINNMDNMNNSNFIDNNNNNLNNQTPFPNSQNQGE